jgi:hypothetical protein
VNYIKAVMKSRRARIRLLTLLLGIPLALHAAPVTIPNTFTAGAVISSAQVNANFTALANQADANDTRIGTLEGTTGGITTVTNASCGMTTTYSNCLTLTVTLPASGYVYLIGSGMIQLSASSTNWSACRVGISQVSSGTPNTSSATRLYFGPAISMPFEIPYTVHHVTGFLTAGTHSFFLVGVNDNLAGSGCTLFSNRLTAQFFPKLM